MAIKSVAEKKAALLAELADIEEQEKKIEEAKFTILGRVVNDEMKADPEFRETINTLLSNVLRKNAERELFGFEKLKSNRGRPTAVTV